jgi:hypothetical protein
MRYALSMVDGRGIPFWTFLIQLFCVIIVIGITIILLFSIMTCVWRMLDSWKQ